MILKSYEIDNKKISKFNFFLVYGENEGLKKELINKIKSDRTGKQIKYEESEILKNKSNFNSAIKNKSLFEEKRIFLIERCTEKLSDILLEISENLSDDLIIINFGQLEKRSKLRNQLEKSEHAVVIPTYKDSSQSLINIAKSFFSENKISISYETLNLLVNRSNGDRGHLRQELNKISNYLSDKKIISLKEIHALTNLSENYSADELADTCLSKNIKKTYEILNENNYTDEDIFVILRVFLRKSKKILNLLESINNMNNVDKVITEYRPPIFWKEKPVIKKQLQLWTCGEIKNLIFGLNEIEIKIKKNNSLSMILMKNFINEILHKRSNNSSLLIQ